MMKGGGEKMKKEPKKLIKGGREQKLKHNGGRENVEQNKRLENAQKTSKIHMMRKPDRLYLYFFGGTPLLTNFFQSYKYIYILSHSKYVSTQTFDFFNTP